MKINGDTLEFSASGVGASGERRNYEFELDFYDHVDKGFMVRPTPTAVQLIIKKDRESCYMWKQLVRGQKPKFLKSQSFLIGIIDRNYAIFISSNGSDDQRHGSQRIVQQPCGHGCGEAETNHYQ